MEARSADGGEKREPARGGRAGQVSALFVRAVGQAGRRPVLVRGGAGAVVGLSPAGSAHRIVRLVAGQWAAELSGPKMSVTLPPLPTHVPEWFSTSKRRVLPADGRNVSVQPT